MKGDPSSSATSDVQAPDNLSRRQALGAIVGGSAALGLAPLSNAATKEAPAPRRGTITLEEHYSLPAAESVLLRPASIGPDRWASLVSRLEDVEQRLKTMDANGVDMQIVSLTAHGCEGQPDKVKSVALAKAANDWVSEKFVKAHPDRFGAFATVPLQDPAAAAREVERAVTKLGLKGVLINGYVNVGDTEHGEYLDNPMFLPFWEAVSHLDVPVYLHPRNPLPNQQRIYEGRQELLNAVWGFAVETATHALRLITSGLFDKFPKQQLILGHMGEGLVTLMSRADGKLRGTAEGRRLQRHLPEYMRENFHITTSGFFHTPMLQNVIAEMGTDRVLFSVDYPYEDMAVAATWFEDTPLSPADRVKIGRGNAEKLFKL